MTCNCKNTNHASRVKLCSEAATKARVVRNEEDLISLEIVSGKKWSIGDQFTIEEVCRQPR